MYLLHRLLLTAVCIAAFAATAATYRYNPPSAAILLATILVLALGLFVYVRDRSSGICRAFALVCLALVAHGSSVYLVHMATLWGIDAVIIPISILRVGTLLIPVSFMYFAYVFTGRKSRLLRVLTVISLLSMLPFLVLDFTGHYITAFQKLAFAYVPTEPGGPYAACAVLIQVWFLLWLAIMAVHYYREKAPARRRQYLVILAGCTLGVIAGMPAFLPALGASWFPEAVGMGLLVSPVALAAGILRFDRFDLKLALRKTLPYVFGTALIGALYALYLAGLRWMEAALGILPAGADWVVLLIIVGLAFQPALNAFQTWLERLFPRKVAGPDECISRYRANKAAEAAERLTGAVFDSMVNAVVLVDEDGLIISSNPAFRGLFGQSEGRTVSSIGLKGLERMEGEGPAEVHTDERVFLATSRAVDITSRGTVSIIVLTDITELRRLEESSRRQQALAETGSIISSVNHEISNIMAPVTFHLEDARESSSSEGGRRAWKAVKQRIDMLDRFSRELRDYYKEPQLYCAEVSLGNVVRSALEDMKSAAGDDWVEPETEGLDLTVFADPQKLKQVLLNLFRNAWEAMSASEYREWSLRARRKDDCIAIRISDNGRGIESDAIEHVFEPFFSIRKKRGIGLGLPVARRIAEAHGARIRIQSTPGEGTEAVLFWPADASGPGNRP